MLSLNEKDEHHQNKYMMEKVTSERTVSQRHGSSSKRLKWHDKVLLLNPRAEVKKASQMT